MRIISGLCVILSLVLVSEATGSWVAKRGTLIGQQEISTKELTKEELLEKLKDYDYAEKGGTFSTEYVSGLLDKTKAKKETEVINGVTVAELIAQNEFRSLELECTKGAFRRRAGIYKKTRPTGRLSQRTITNGLNVYALTLLRKATYECYDSKEALVHKRINERDFLYSLWDAYYNEVLHGENFEKDAVDAVIFSNEYSPIAKVIEEDAEKEQRGSIRR